MNARSKAKATTMKPTRKTPTKRSAPGAALADPRYRARIVKSAKVYRRKTKTLVREDDDA